MPFSVVLSADFYRISAGRNTSRCELLRPIQNDLRTDDIRIARHSLTEDKGQLFERIQMGRGMTYNGRKELLLKGQNSLYLIYFSKPLRSGLRRNPPTIAKRITLLTNANAHTG